MPCVDAPEDSHPRELISKSNFRLAVDCLASRRPKDDWSPTSIDLLYRKLITTQIICIILYCRIREKYVHVTLQYGARISRNHCICAIWNAKCLIFLKTRNVDGMHAARSHAGGAKVRSLIEKRREKRRSLNMQRISNTRTTVRRPRTEGATKRGHWGGQLIVRGRVLSAT